MIEKQVLQDYLFLLEKKKQLVFFGPPGAGKTFVAREIAKYWTHNQGERDGKVVTVQFHPNYSYEDFVEGYRPVNASNQRPSQHASFQLVGGPFKSIVQEAQQNLGSYFVLLIDELNRGNVAKIFGELLYLLEYRDSGIRLQYSDNNSPEFVIPQNLFIIATMNTYDRSLTKLDSALRRRFFFLPFVPDEEPVKGLLRRWLDKNKPEMRCVADLVERGNELLARYHASFVIPFSHFMTLELNAKYVKLIWQYSIIPEAKEYLPQSAISEFQSLVELVLAVTK